jgi:hypothetical protein
MRLAGKWNCTGPFSPRGRSVGGEGGKSLGDSLCDLWVEMQPLTAYASLSKEIRVPETLMSAWLTARPCRVGTILLVNH